MSQFIDFNALKQRVSILQVLEWLNVPLKKSSTEQFRGACPIHQGTNPREFVVTPSKGLYFCFAGCGGGDAIKLVAKVKDCEPKEAARLIDEAFGNSRVTAARNSTVTSPTDKGTVISPCRPALRPFDYLQPQHEAVQALGVSVETAKIFESGYAPKGTLREYYAVPVKARDGTLLAYVGIAVNKQQSPFLKFVNFDPTGALWNVERVQQGGDLWVCKDPLAAILAVENGIPAESIVAFLSPITAQSLEMIASLMDEKKIETCEIP